MGGARVRVWVLLWSNTNALRVRPALCNGGDALVEGNPSSVLRWGCSVGFPSPVAVPCPGLPRDLAKPLNITSSSALDGALVSFSQVSL